jgi:hypothetical protein
VWPVANDDRAERQKLIIDLTSRDHRTVDMGTAFAQE